MGNSVVAAVVIETLMLPENFAEVTFLDVGGKCVTCMTSCICFPLKKKHQKGFLTSSLLGAAYCFTSTDDWVELFL